MIALKRILVKVDLSGICFVLGVTEGTVLEWLHRASLKAEEINEHLLRELPVTEVQLDEMWNFVERKHSHQADPDGESSESSPDGRQWIWISFAPEFRLILATYGGPRVYQSALKLMEMTAAIVMGIPCFFSDGLSSYLPALIELYHTVKVFPRTGKRGRPKQPVKEPPPDLVYAQVIKHKQRGRLKELVYRVLCGSKRLEELGLSISTSLIERLNLTVRQGLAPLVRKSWSFCKDRTRLAQRVVFFQAFYNFARPHMSLRLPLHLKDINPHQLLQDHLEDLFLVTSLHFHPVQPTLQSLYSPVKRRTPRDPQAMLRSFLLMTHHRITSIPQWVQKTRSEPLLAILCGFPPDDTPGVGTYYDFIDRFIDGPYQKPCDHVVKPSAQRKRTYLRNLDHEALKKKQDTDPNQPQTEKLANELLENQAHLPNRN